MKIAEIFYSIQGEGKLAGTPSVFIRTSGCNLRCIWCDTPYTSWEPEGEAMSIDQILDRVSDHATTHVVLTGGEPLIELDVPALTHRLREEGYHITIETAGTVWADVACDLMSISPKLGNSTPWSRDEGGWADKHEARRLNLPVLRRLVSMGEYQLKFVMDVPDDLVEVDALLARLGTYDTSDVLLMPQGVTSEQLDARASWIVDICKQRGFRFCPRLQIDLFGHTRGT